MADVGPGVDAPACGSEGHSIECSIGNLEITRRGETPASRVTVDALEHAAVGEDQQFPSWILFHQFVDHRERASVERAQRLAGFEVEIEVFRPELRVFLRKTL